VRSRPFCGENTIFAVFAQRGANVTKTPVAASSGWSNDVLKCAVSPGPNRAVGGSMILNCVSLSAGSRSATRSRGTSRTALPVLVMSPSMTKPSAVRAGAIFASYSGTDAKSCTQAGATAATAIGSAVCGAKAKMYSVGYDYILSKRTKMYVAYNKIDNGTVTTNAGAVQGSSYYYIAGPATNNGNGNSGALAAGTDVTTFGVGIQHVF